MIGGKSFLAIVPARGGSKGVPRKNIKAIAGQPLIGYTADQIAAVHEIDCAVVSTEDAEIKSVAIGLGMRVIDRPRELSADESRSEPVMLHALAQTEEEDGVRYDNVILLEPTSPLRTPETIRACMEKLVETGSPSLLTVARMNEFIGEGIEDRFRPLFPDERGRRQDRADRFYMNGTVFACTAEHLKSTGELMCDDWPYVIVSGDENTDINTEADFEYAEYLLMQKA